MKMNRLILTILIAISMTFFMIVTVSAADYTPADPDNQGMGGIIGGDTLTFTKNTVWANLTARWGVRVIFRDGDEWNNKEFRNELLPVTDDTGADTTAPDDPFHEGWKFIGWERVDTNGGPSALNDDGTVTGINGPGPIIYQAMYEPVPPAAGNLTVSKTVSGNAADSTKPFAFTVTLSDTSVSGTYGDLDFKDGTAAFTLRGGESVTATGLPGGTGYTVEEADYRDDGYETSRTGDTGSITDGGTATAAFTNTKNSNEPEDPPAPPDDPEDPPAPPDDPGNPPVDPGTGSLTVSKTVAGTDGDSNKAFTFTITLSDSGTYAYTGSRSGTVTSGGTVQLRHGESVTVSGLPEGTVYSVAESDNIGYEVTKTGDIGTISADTTATAAFTNSKDAEPSTDPGDPDDPDTPDDPEDPDEPSTPDAPEDPGEPDTPGSPGTPDMPAPPDMPAAPTAQGEPAALKTGDDSNMTLWSSLMLISVICIYVCFVLSRKNRRNGNRLWTLLLPVLAGIIAFSGSGAANAYAAGNDGAAGFIYGQYDMTYLPGTADTVTNMPENESGLTPGADTPYTVSSAVPLRAGFEFIDWTLTWGTVQTVSYTVRYLEYGTEKALAPEKEITGMEVGTKVTETAVSIENYKALDPTETTIELADGENVIIFWYDKEPAVTSYTVYYLDEDYNEIAPSKKVSDVPVGAEITETAVDIASYQPVEPTELTYEMKEDANRNVFEFIYKCRDDY